MVLHDVAQPSGESRVIQEGDTVVVYERFDAMKAVVVSTKGQYSNRFGNFAMKEWIGKPYGSRVHARAPDSGWAYVLAPTPELWTGVLRHRTQILYVADISMVVAMMELQPGCTVLESGTGSGSLTTSLARAVAPSGHVHTFEFHELRAQLAREDFERNGLSELVTVQQRNIEQDGFPTELHGHADALFLDLPGPWRAVPSAGRCLRPDGVFCAFSPCIEQVQRTCEALARSGEFHCLQTMEVLLRSYEVSSVTLGEVREPSNDQLDERIENGLGPMEEEGTTGVDSTENDQPNDNGTASEQEEGNTVDENPTPAKKPKVETNGTESTKGADPAANTQLWAQTPVSRVLARPVASGRGHTGYLTFARRAVPVAGHSVAAEGDEEVEEEAEMIEAPTTASE